MSAFRGKADMKLQPAAITSLGQNWKRGFSSGQCPLLVVLICAGAILQRVLPLAGINWF
jgi:hypothetical protein